MKHSPFEIEDEEETQNLLKQENLQAEKEDSLGVKITKEIG